MAYSSQFPGASWINGTPKKANGLLGLLGVSSNPFTDFLGNNSNALIGLGAGIAGGGPDLGQAVGQGLTLAGQGKTADFNRNEKAKADALLASQTNQTLNYLRKNFPDIAAKVDAGLPMDQAWSEALAAGKPKAPIKASPGDVFLDPTTMQPVTSVPDQPAPYTLGPQDTRFGPDNKPIAQGQPTIKTENAPNGYRYTADGSLQFIPGGPADPSTASKTTEATRRNQQLATVMLPELKSLLGDGRLPGTFDALADLGQQTRNGIPGVGNFLTSPEFQQAQNSMRTIVASYLYSVSGATANPGEVENQVSVLTPRPGDSPQTVAAKKQRLQDMVQAVVAAASGTPISVDPSQLPDVSQPAPVNGGTTSSGVQWTVTP